MDRNTVMWTMVVFFGSGLMFALIQRGAEDGGVGITLLAQVAAGALLIAVIVLFMKRRGD